MFQAVFSVVLLSLFAGAFGLQCNSCSNAPGSANNCSSPVSVTCSLANSIQTQSALMGYFNTSIDSTSTDFQCMSLNTSVTTGSQNTSIQIEGCVPQSDDVCKLSVFTFSTEDRKSCSTCNSDNCNNFDNNGGTTPSPSGEVTQCYSCDGQDDCQNPKVETCDYNSALSTVTKLLGDYNFDIASYIQKGASKSYSCYSANISFDINGLSGVWNPLIYKGCIFEDLSPCSFNLTNGLTQNVSSCYTCDSNSCNQGSTPSGGSQGQCYVCNSYPCLDEEVVNCDQEQVNATYDILRDLYSNVPEQGDSDTFQCLSLRSKYAVTARKYLGPIPVYLKGCVSSNFNVCDLQVNSLATEQRSYCDQCNGELCNSNVNAPKKNATIYVEM
ncbi:hypothetical protein ACFFRR_003934 [Megaselia abdita]